MDPPKSNGSILGHYPSNPGTQSTIIAACQFDARTGTSDVSPSFSLHDFNNAVWHNGAARSVVVTSVAGTSVGLDNCRGLNVGGDPGNYVNSTITGGTTAARRHIASFTSGCTAASDTGTIVTNVAPGSTVGNTLLVENSKGRTSADGSTTSGSATVTSTNATFTAADVGCSISGTNIDPGTTIATFVSASSVTMSAPANATGTAQVFTICGSEEVTTARTTNSANFASSTSLTDSGAVSNRFAATDVGLEVFDAVAGAAVTEPCVITGFVSATSVTVAHRETGAGCLDGSNPLAERSVVIGEPNFNSPDDGDQLVHLNVQLDLNPALVGGQDACTNDTPEGFAIAGTYRNPGTGNFISGPFATQPAGTKAVGQIVFDTSVVDFAAYILERRSLDPGPVGGEPIGVPHYDFNVPNAPTGVALCPSATSPGLSLALTVDASTSSITSLANGLGRPGTAQVRNLRSTQAGNAGVMYMRSDDGVAVWSGPDFERSCIVPAAPYEVDFRCGP